VHPLQDTIVEALEQIRPTLIKDGGDVELVGIDESNIVTVRLTGACEGCPMSEVTIKQGIEKFIKIEVPGVTEVVAEKSK